MRRALAIVVVLAPGLARADDPKEVLRGDVLVWDDAKLLVDPDDPASAVQLATFQGAREDHLGAVFAMKVVGTKGELVEVEPEATRGCVGATVDVAYVPRAHLFVARADLAPVLGKPFRATFADGSRVELRPGVAVRAASDGDTIAQLDLRDLALKIPASSIAHSYPASPPHKPATFPNGVKLYSTLEGTPVAIAGTTWSNERLRLQTEHATAKGDRMLLEMVDRCGTVVVSAPRDQVKALQMPGFGEGRGVGNARAPLSDFVPKGTPLATASGHRVGTTSEDVAVTPSADGKLACAELSIELELDSNARHPRPQRGKVTLCAPAKAAKHVGPQAVKKLSSPPKN